MVRKSWQEPNIFLSSLIKLSQLAFIVWTLSVENVDNFFSTWIGCKRRAHGGQLQRRFYLINISLFSKSKQESNLLKKISLFSSFLFALKFDQLKSINIWKSKLKISGKIILYKPCYNCKICNSVNVLYELFFPLQYAMLVPAVVLFAFGILIYFCLIPSPDEIGEYKHLYKVVSHIEVTFIFWSDKIISSKYS